MKNTLKNGLLVLTIIATLASCSKSNSPKPTSKLSYQFRVATSIAPLNVSLHDSRQTTMSLNAPSPNIYWQSGFADVSSITLGGKNESDGDNNNEIDNFIEPKIYKVDLFAGNTLLGNIDIANSTYINVSVKLNLRQTSTDPALYLNGTYTSSAGQSIPVNLSFIGENEDFEILVKAKNITIGNTQNYVEFLDLHLNTLMAGVTGSDMDKATLTNGTIVISSTANTAIYNKILANINDFCDGEDN